MYQFKLWVFELGDSLLIRCRLGGCRPSLCSQSITASPKELWERLQGSHMCYGQWGDIFKYTGIREEHKHCCVSYTSSVGSSVCTDLPHTHTCAHVNQCKKLSHKYGNLKSVVTNLFDHEDNDAKEVSWSEQTTQNHFMFTNKYMCPTTCAYGYFILIGQFNDMRN